MKFAVIFLSTLLVGLLGVAAVNYFVNPYAMYPPRWFTPASANDLERSLREMDSAERDPELVVLGSSRSMRLLPRDLDCYSDLWSANQAYAGATPQGYFALASHLLETRPAPKMLLIGVDVEAFQSEAKFGDKVSAVPRLQRYLQDTSQLENIWLDATNLVSYAQLSDSLAVVQRAYGAGTSPLTALEQWWKQKVNTLAPKAAAGKNRPPPSERPPKPAEVRAENAPANVIKHYQKRFRGYTELNAEQQAYFKALLQLARENNIRVKLFITTLHPQLVAALNKQGFYPKRYADVRAWLNELEREYAFEQYDFSTPDKFGGTNTDFFNLSHIDEINSARLLDVMFTETGHAAKCAPQ